MNAAGGSRGTPWWSWRGVETVAKAFGWRRAAWMTLASLSGLIVVYAQKPERWTIAAGVTAQTVFLASDALAIVAATLQGRGREGDSAVTGWTMLGRHLRAHPLRLFWFVLLSGMAMWALDTPSELARHDLWGAGLLSLSAWTPTLCVLLTTWQEWSRPNESQRGILARAWFSGLVVLAWYLAVCGTASDPALYEGDEAHALEPIGLAITAALTVGLQWGAGLAAYLLVYDCTTGPAVVQTDIGALAAREGAWLKARRRLRNLAEGSTEHARPPGLVGVALSGGGIRAASVALGFLRALDRSGVLRRADYLSTVSGGGWPGAAFTLAARDPEMAVDPMRVLPEARWEALTDRFRLHRDYFLPGGIGFTSATLTPVVSMLWGAVVNLASAVLLALSMSALLIQSQLYHGVLFRLLRKLDEVPAFRWMLLDHASHLGRTFAILNIVGAAFGLSLALLIGGLVWLTAAYFASDAWVVPATRFSASALRWTVVFAFADMALLGRREVTLLVLGAAALLLVAFAGRSITQGHVASMLALVGALSGTAGTEPHLKRTLNAITHGWHDPMVNTLLRYRGWIIDWDRIVSNAGLLWALAFFMLWALWSLVVGPNRTGMFLFWQAQIRRAFLGPYDPAPSALGVPARGAVGPLPIVNCTVNTPGSPDPKLSGRRSARFEVTPLHVGGPATGWCSSECYDETLTWSRAVAISAAALNSEGGEAIPAAARMLFFLLNVRFGVWMNNPRFAGDAVRFRRAFQFWFAYALSEFQGTNNEFDPLVFVSDGGHHDNLGLSALVERGCELVVCLDAGADPAWRFEDLARVARMLRLDGKWEFVMDDRDALRPANPLGSVLDRTPKQSIAIGHFRSAERTVTLVLAKAALMPAMPLEVWQYAESQQGFPQQPTSDQFFDAVQFEAYHVLGEQLALAVDKALSDADAWREVTSSQSPA